MFQSVDRADRLSGRPLALRAVLAMIKFEGGGRRAAGVDLLPHVSGDGHHGVSGERGNARTRAADCRPCVPEEDEALRPDGGHDQRRLDRTHRDLIVSSAGAGADSSNGEGAGKRYDWSRPTIPGGRPSTLYREAAGAQGWAGGVVFRAWANRLTGWSLTRRVVLAMIIKAAGDDRRAAGPRPAATTFRATGYHGVPLERGDAGSTRSMRRPDDEAERSARAWPPNVFAGRIFARRTCSSRP